MARVCLLMLALWSAGVHGAARLCPDGVTYGTTTAAVDDCPPYRTGVLITDVTQTGARITGTGDAQTAGSKHYYYASESTHPPGCTALDYAYSDLSSPVPATRQAAVRARQGCMDWKTMVAGTGAAAYGSIDVPSPGGFGLDITGLTEGSTYYVQEFHVGGAGGVGKISVLGTHLLVTAEQGGGEPEDPGEVLVADGGAAPRYVGDGGSNANNGLTHATRKLTPSAYSYVGLPPGTNIGFWNESVFALPSFTVNYGGLSTDWNIIGSYRLNGSGDPIWTYDGVRGGGGAAGGGTTDAKAIFRGGLTDECIENGTCTFPVTGFPREGYSSQYAGMINLTPAADFTELRNIVLEKGRYGTIVATGGGVYEGLRGLIFDGIDTRLTGFQNPIALTDGVADVIVRRSSSYGHGICSNAKTAGTTTDAGACSIGSIWSGSFVVATRRARRILIEGNDVVQGFGEGINNYNAVGEYTEAGWSIIRDNRVMNVWSTTIYVDGFPNVVVENNILVGGSGQQLNVTNNGPSFECISVSSEALGYPNAVKNIIRNNLALGCGRGISGQMFNAVANGGDKIGAQVINNTVIGSWASHSNQYDSLLSRSGANVEQWRYEGNVSWNEALGVNACNSTFSGEYISNHWFVAQSDPDCVSPSDSTGNPGLAQSAYSFWTSLRNQNGASPTWPTWADITPAVASPLLNTSPSYSTPEIDLTKFGWPATQMADVRSGAISLDLWSRLNHYDALNQVRSCDDGLNDKGAVVRCSSPSTPVVAADAITISPNGRYFRRGGSAFNYVGCTAWLATKQSVGDMDTYLEDRAARGCNVVHGPILHDLSEEVAATTGPIQSTSPFAMRASYFETKVDHFVEKATALGMNIFFPLAWGPNCKRDVLENATNARTYADYIVSRYAAYSNIVWVGCGEYTKIADNAPAYLTSGDVLDSNEQAIIDALIAGIEAHKHPDSLTTLHPDGLKSTAETDRHPTRNFHTEGWLDFNVLQSYGSNLESINDLAYAWSLSPARPVLQSELFYEDSVSVSPSPLSVVTPWHVRLAAWTARLSGSAGYTYGHGDIWRFASGWEADLADTGADDIFTHYKAFWDEHHDETLVDARDWLTGDKGNSAITANTYEVAMRTSAGDKMVVYSPQGHDINVITNNLSGTVRARWFDPRAGGYTLISSSVTKSANTTFDCPGSPAVDNDCVLVLD